MSSNIREVAKKAGLSHASVSRFLNGYKIKKENEEKIKKAIEELGFKESPIIKAMRTKKSMSIGVLVPGLIAPYFMEILQKIEKILFKYKYNLILCSYELDTDIFIDKVNLLTEKLIDGLIIFPAAKFKETKNLIHKIIKNKTPVVILDEFIESFQTDSIVVRNREASFRAVEYLINNNHKKIGIITGIKNAYVANERLQGCIDAFKAYGIEFDANYIKYGDYTSEGGVKCTKKLLKMENPPTAIFTLNFDMTMGAVLAINNSELSIYNDISLVGFDRYSLTDAISPALTLIEQPIENLANETVDLLLKRMKGDYNGFPSTIKLDAKLIIRDSVKKI